MTRRQMLKLGAVVAASPMSQVPMHTTIVVLPHHVENIAAGADWVSSGVSFPIYATGPVVYVTTMTELLAAIAEAHRR